MKQENRLNAQEIKAALRKGEKVRLNDGGSLTLVISGFNAGYWLFQGNVTGAGERVSITICRVSNSSADMSLSEVRKKRDEYRALLRQGINPNKEKARIQEQEKAEQERQARTFRKVCEEWLETQGNLAGRTVQQKRARLENWFYPLYGDMPYDAVTYEDYKSFIEPLFEKATPDIVRRFAGYLESIGEYAADICKYVPRNPAIGIKRFAVVISRKYPEEDKHLPAVTKIEDIRRVLRRIDTRAESANTLPYTKYAIRLLPYWFFRINELLSLRWDDIDLENNKVTFLAEKKHLEYTQEVPISPQAKALLLELKNYAYNKMLFPSGNKNGGHLSDVTVRKQLRLAGIPAEKMSLHGFRTVFSTLCHNAGLSHALIEKMLSHKSGDEVSRAYDRSDLWQARTALMTWWADTVDAIKADVPLQEPPFEIVNRYL